MTTRKYSSRAQQTTLSAPLSSGVTTMTVVSGANLMGGKTPSTIQTFTIVVDPDTAIEEIMDVSNYSSGNTLTVTRGIDGSSAVAHSAGAVVRHMVIGRDLQEANDHSENSTTAHGLTLANVVKTTDTGTVTSTMLADGTIVNADINASAGIVDTKLATIATAGKVSNSATTAASANTASAIVARDASGNFTAGTVTANLTGNVTGNVTGTVSGNAGTVTNGVYTTDTGTVTSTMILDGTIANGDVSASAGLVYSKLSLNASITSADLVDGTIVAGDIANGTITAAKMVSDPYARANHTGTQTASTVSDFDTQVRTSRLEQMATPIASVALGAQKITGLADPTLDQDAATKAYTDAKVAALVNSAPGTLDTLGEIATAISSGGAVFDAMVLKAGSTMTGALVLSGAPTIDLHAATKLYVDGVAGSATAAAASASAAATTYDNFDDRYLGAKSSAPTLDNDGAALITGALYWNSVSNAMFAWSGSAWGSISSTAEIYRYKYIAAGGETSVSGADANGLTLSYLPGKEQVYLNGVLLVRGTDYTGSTGTSLTALAALTASDVLEIITFTAFDVATSIANTLFDAKGDILVATAADTAGKLTAGTNGYYLKADSSTATGLVWSAVDLSAYAPLASPTFTGTVTIPAGVVGTAANAGYMGIPQNATTTGSATIAAADNGKHIHCTATRTLTIDSNANLALPIGFTFSVTAATGATVTIAITTDTMYLSPAGTTGSRTLAAFGIATAIKITSTTWMISGSGLT